MVVNKRDGFYDYPPLGSVSPETPSGSDDVRQTPVNDSALLRSINETLNSLPDKTATAVLQIPEDGRLRGGVYVNVGNGLSFMGWLDKDLNAKTGFGAGVAVRKSW